MSPLFQAGPVLQAAPDALGAVTFAGPMLLALPVAALAGLVSFVSPCVLPLLPATWATSPG